MRLSNIHTHTRYCDGEGSPADYCRAAARAGLLSIGFSAHAPVDGATGFRTGWHLPEKDFAAYRDDVLALKAACAGGPAVFLGLEADYIADCQSPRDFAGRGLDYLIGSVHCAVPPGLSARAFFERAGKLLCVDGGAADWARLVDEFFSGDVYRLLDAYWDSVEGMIRDGGFDVLGHADLVKKNNWNAELPPRYRFDAGDARYTARTRRVARALAGSDIVVEINTGGINRGKTPETYPSVPFLRLLRERHVRITINADAHAPEQLTGAYDRAVRAAREAGYREIALFSGGRPGAARWEREPLPPDFPPGITV